MKVKIKESDAFERLPLRAVIDVNSGIESLFRSAYRSINGLPERSKIAELEILVGDFKSGSLEQEIFIALKNVVDSPAQLAFTLSQFGIQDVATVVRNTIEFLKALRASRESGRTMNITALENSIALHVGDNCQVGDIILSTAASASKSGKGIAKHLKNGNLSEIQFGEGQDAVLLTQSDAACFEEITEIDETPRSIAGEIIEFNKVTQSGVFRFIDNMIELRKPIKFLGANISTNLAIDSMKQQRCIVRCLEEFIRHANGQKTTVKLHVLAIESQD